jgi:TRAP-type C4-dicarboxylate transport system permease small subunit
LTQVPDFGTSNREIPAPAARPEKGERIFAALDRVFSQLSGWALFALCIVMGAEVILRYVPWFNLAQDWIPGILIFFDTWMIFLASIVAMQRDNHLRVDFFVKKMPPRMAEWNSLVVNIITLGLLVLVTYTGIPIFRSGMDLNYAGLPFPKGLAFLALPFCTALMALMVVRRIVLTIRKLAFEGGR